MKIEMCESLFYSWLRHIKGCQIVQTNWKPSPAWDFENVEKVEKFMKVVDTYFQEKYKYDIFKKNAVSQLIQQAESDLIGISLNGGDTVIYAVESAFHEGGLNDGGTEETVTRIIKKFVRTGLCINSYFGTTEGELIFASPKIDNAVINDLNKCTGELNGLFKENGFGFAARIIANEEFAEEVLIPVTEIGGEVNDTSELFMRSWQLISMFGQPNVKKQSRSEPSEINIQSRGNETKKSAVIGNIDTLENSRFISDVFKRYLTANNYAYNTVNSYVNYVQGVAKWEHIDVVTLAKKIHEILPKYDKGGVYQDRGQNGHSGVINALRRFEEFIEMIISQKGKANNE